MDPDVTTTTLPGYSVTDGLLSLPSLSIVGKLSDLVTLYGALSPAELTSGSLVRVFTSGTMVQVFLLAAKAPTEQQMFGPMNMLGDGALETEAKR